MTALLLLLGWMLVNGLVGWRPGWLGPWTPRLALGLTLLTLLGSKFWHTVAWALMNWETPPLAGPEAAYLSVWALVLLPILRRQLDARALGATLLSGLVAAAAFGLAHDSAAWILAGLGTSGSTLTGGSVLIIGVHAILASAGLNLRHLMGPARIPATV
ncbi:MAG: hypothetical protein ACUVT0_11530, partial [Thermochromatium sp.]